MKITILETGEAPAAIRDRFEDYPAMFRALLSAVDPTLSFETVSVVKGDRLPDVTETEAVVITGSAAGVYESHPWLEPLSDFIRVAADARVPQVGICFGHQILAQALGGEVVKSEKGWGLGRHTYEMLTCPAWADDDCPASISVAVSHQDQVVALPPGGKVIAKSEFTPFAGVEYTEQRAMSFQCHPEFSAEFSAALYESRRGRPLSDQQVETATQSLSQPLDNARLGRWMVNFVKATA